MRKLITWISALLVSGTFGGPTLGCATQAPIDLRQVKLASVVVVAHLQDTRGAPDTHVPGEQSTGRDPESFKIYVDKILKGKADKTLKARWSNGSARVSEDMTEGSFVVALIDVTSPSFPHLPHLPHPSHLDPKTLIVLQELCSEPFVFPTDSTQTDDIRHILAGKPLAHHQQVLSPIWAVAPDMARFANFYPKKALEDEVGGNVSVDCLATKSGRLTACKVTSESPDNYGFGEATKAWVQHGTRLKLGTFFSGDIIRMKYGWSPD